MKIAKQLLGACVVPHIHEDQTVTWLPYNELFTPPPGSSLIATYVVIDRVDVVANKVN